MQVLQGLNDGGFRACLVGGAVRDLLLGEQPKDFDVATDAEPEQVCELFRRARLIGRRFRIVHVRFGREIIEVSTFRADPDSSKAEDTRLLDDNGRVLRDNVFGDIAQDARRRDFAINALYYDGADHGIYDYVDGMADVRARRMRLIGDPAVRYREDPVRMLRAVRIAGKLDLTIDPAAEATPELVALLADVPAARMFDEVLKMLMHPAAPQVYAMLRQRGLLAPLFAQTVAVLEGPDGATSEALIENAIANTAQRMRADRPVTPAFIFAALLWPAVNAATQRLQQDGNKPLAPALASAQSQVIAHQVQSVSIPKRFAVPMREIWQLQPRFQKRRGKQPQRLMTHPRFRAAYDFLLLRAEVGEVDAELAQWWTDIQKDPDSPVPVASSGKRRRRGGRRRRRRSGGDTNS